MLLPDKFEYPPSNGSKPLLVLLAENLGLFQGTGNTVLMIMALINKGRI